MIHAYQGIQIFFTIYSFYCCSNEKPFSGKTPTGTRVGKIDRWPVASTPRPSEWKDAILTTRLPPVPKDKTESCATVCAQMSSLWQVLMMESFQWMILTDHFNSVKKLTRTVNQSRTWKSKINCCWKFTLSQPSVKISGSLLNFYFRWKIIRTLFIPMGFQNSSFVYFFTAQHDTLNARWVCAPDMILQIPH